MNIKHVKTVTDAGSHFLVDHAKHGAFKVAKKGLNKETLRKVQAMCQGGAVQRFAGVDGPAAQVVQPDPVDPMDVPSPETGITPRQMADAIKTNPEYSSSPESRAASAGIIPVPTMKDTDQVLSDNPIQSDPMSQVGVSPDQLRISPVAAVDNGQSGPAGSGPTAPGAQPQAASPLAPKPTGPAVPSPNAIFGDMNREGDALRQGANVTAKEEADKKSAQDAYNAQIAARQTAFDASLKRQNDEYDHIRQDVENTQINPNRMWQSMTTGNKVLASIGMILSGIGAGANGKNQALDVMNKSIDQDIDAQKANLQKKQTLLGDNLRKTGDMREAENLTRAQMLSGLQGQVNSIAAKYGGDKAKANANFLANQIGERKDMLKYTIASQRAQAAGEQQVNVTQVLQAYDRTRNGYGTADDEVLLKSPPAEKIVGKELGKQIVNTSTGRALAHDDDAAQKYRKDSADMAGLQSHIDRLTDLGKQAAGGNYSQKSRQEFEAARDGAVLEMGKLAGLSRFTPEEAKRFEARIRNLNDPLQARGGYFAGLKGIQDEVDDKMLSSSNTYLMRPNRNAIKDAK